MTLFRRTAVVLLAVLFAGPALADGTVPTAPHVFQVELTAPGASAASGRLLLFAVNAKEARAHSKDGNVTEVSLSPFGNEQGSVAARDISHLTPGAPQELDADEVAYPAGFSQLPPGDYLMQAVLDVNHDYNYGGRSPGDVVSKIIKVTLPAKALPVIKLDQVLGAAPDVWTLPARATDKQRATLADMRKDAHAIDFTSPALTAFWGRPIHMKGWVLTPPSYDARSSKTWPTVYYTHGFGGNLRYLLRPTMQVYTAMKDGQMPPMIWVFLDEASATGTHEFADSVNNGPWGEALTTELIPHLEGEYRMDARASGRFLQGHSSGGWATLWLQTRYPKIFGGTWSTSPDPSDFHDFTGINLYAPNANVYHRPDGSKYALVRMDGKVVATLESFAKLEAVIGPYGGQIASFEWVFSPRGKGGRPEPMFNRATGDVYPKVVDYWRDHYDIAYLVKKNWATLKPNLDGKIHLYVGTADTFYLDGAAHKLKAVLDRLGAKSSFRFLPGKTHFNLYQKGKDKDWLLKDISWQMYKVARPEAKLKEPKAVAAE